MTTGTVGTLLSDLLPAFESREFTVNVTSSAVPVVSGDSRRYSLIFSIASGPGVFVSTNQDSSISTGFFVEAAAKPLVMTFRDFPGLINRAWFARQNGPPSALTVGECLYDPTQLGGNT